MTYRNLCRRLADAGIEDPHTDAGLLLEHFCKLPHGTVPGTPDAEFDAPGLEDAVRRRAAREPLQYLLGEWYFYRQRYEVSPDCLIPRSDTERLVEEAVGLLPPGARFADLCTGSGCIAVSVLAERTDTSALAVDLFPATLALACRNAEKNRVSDRFLALRADLTDPAFTLPEPPFDAILCNPPYIRTGDLPTLAPELSAEPAAALDGGADGLRFYRVLAGMGRFLTPDGFFLLEIGYDQAKDVGDLFRAAGYSGIRVIRDYGGNDRVLHVPARNA